MSNQPLAFGALIAGGLLITSAVTGQSIGKVVAGQVTTLTNGQGTARIDSNVAQTVNSVDGLVNPFAHAQGLVTERVDMGRDFAMTPGSPIGAIGRSRMIGILPGWYKGQPFAWYQLLNENGGTSPTKSNPHAGKYWYVSEQINLLTKPGDVVAAGQPVATYAQSGTGIEIGWAAGNGQTLGQAKGDVDPSSHYSAEGQQFADMLKALGVK